MGDAQNLYDDTVIFIHNLQAIANAFIGGHYEPNSFNGVNDEIHDLTGNAQDIGIIGTRMINWLISSSNARHYKPAYIRGAGAWFRGVDGFVSELQQNITAYRALAEPDLDQALVIMNQIMQLERWANYYRDPYNEGYPSILTIPSSIDSLLSAVAGTGDGKPIVPDEE